MTASIKVTTSNCDAEHHFLVNESATSVVHLEMHFDEIVSTQSRTQRKNELTEAIQGELSKFRWLIAGSVQVEFCWYLHAIERQETDKVGDIDNITKPILDALTGKDGLLVDDSQIGSVHTYWMSRHHQLTYSVLRLDLQFSNDDCVRKEDLYFVQYCNAVCLAINVDFSDPKSVFGVLLATRARRWHRALASTIRAYGEDFDRFLVTSTWEFHRTRLSGFPRATVLTLTQFIALAVSRGFSRAAARPLWRSLRHQLLKMRATTGPPSD